MGVQIAAAMGAEVTVLSQTLSKREDSAALRRQPLPRDIRPRTFSELAGRFHLILNTVSANLDLDAYLRLLRVDGTLVTVGAPSKADSVHAFSLIAGRRASPGLR